MTERPDIMGINEAAEYLGITVAGVKHHLYDVCDLEADDSISGVLIFYKESLDRWDEQVRRRPGRPRYKDASYSQEES